MSHWLIEEKLIPYWKTTDGRFFTKDFIYGYDDFQTRLREREDLGEKIPQDTIYLSKAFQDIRNNERKIKLEGRTGSYFVQTAAYKLGIRNLEIEPEKTLKERDLHEVESYIDKEPEDLLNEFNTSQIASAVYITDVNKKKIQNPPPMLEMTYKTDAHWVYRRSKKLSWIDMRDMNLFKEMLSFIDILQNNKTYIRTNDSENFCHNVALDIYTAEEGAKVHPSTYGHETPRPVSIKEAIKNSDRGELVDTADHRIAQAIVKRQMWKGQKIKIKDIDVSKKSYPQFKDTIKRINEKILGNTYDIPF